MSTNNSNNSNSSNNNNSQTPPEAPQAPQAILYGPGESYYWVMYALSKIFHGPEPSKDLKDQIPPRIPANPSSQTTFEVVFQFVERLLNCRSHLKLLLAERDLRECKNKKCPYFFKISFSNFYFFFLFL